MRPYAEHAQQLRENLIVKERKYEVAVEQGETWDMLLKRRMTLGYIAWAIACMDLKDAENVAYDAAADALAKKTVAIGVGAAAAAVAAASAAAIQATAMASVAADQATATALAAVDQATATALAAADQATASASAAADQAVATALAATAAVLLFIDTVPDSPVYPSTSRTPNITIFRQMWQRSVDASLGNERQPLLGATVLYGVAYRARSLFGSHSGSSGSVQGVKENCFGG